MTVKRAAGMVATAAIAYYVGFYPLLFLDRVSSVMVGGHWGTGYDPSRQSWWEAHGGFVVCGLVLAALATAIYARIGAARQGGWKRRIGLAVAVLVVAAQPFLQFRSWQQSVRDRFNGGDARVAAWLPKLGLYELLPTVIERLRRGGPDAFVLATATMNFSGGPGELRRVALDRTAPPDARFSASLALAGSPSDEMAVRAVLDEVIRDADADFRASVPRRLAAAHFNVDSEHARAIRRELLLDASPRVRLAALGGDESPVGCDLLPEVVNDPVPEVQLLAFENLRKCHAHESWEAPPSEAVRAERIAIFRKLLEHPMLDIRIGSGYVLALNGDPSGTDAAMQFAKGDPYGKDQALLALAIATIERTLGVSSSPILWTIWKCDRAVMPRGHYPEARNAASNGLERLYGYGKRPPQYEFLSATPAPLLPEYCVSSD